MLVAAKATVCSRKVLYLQWIDHAQSCISVGANCCLEGQFKFIHVCMFIPAKSF